ncbi:MAG: Gfo/Idh/MocA family oxidoreductase [Kiritimatiellae bacterium]|nr:Gfo/Idh/MocA family oxidoreductase [Kiritimatiellia bacterium]
MNLTRKTFLGTGLLALGGCRMFNIATVNPRRPKPSERVNLAVIGCGTQGFANMNGFLQDKRVQITTVCDPVLSAGKYSYRSEKTYGRAPAKMYVDAFYKNEDCRMVADFRDVLADPSVDAVLIATPDHWHAIQSVMAMKAGKSVYCQKPMSLGVSEGQVMARVAKETGVTFQVGSQQRSSSEFRVAAELVASGYIGDCKACEIGLPGGNQGMYGHQNSLCRELWPVPDYFTPKGMWDMWQGPARHWEGNAFIQGIHDPMCWRFNSRTGGGMITDWGAHHLDILQWTLGMDDSGPVAIENMEHDRDPNDRIFDWAANYSFDVVYANGFRAHVSNKLPNGLKFHGKKGDLFVARGKLERPESLRKWNEKKDLKEGDVHLYRPEGGVSHEMDFINAVYSGGRTACPCSVGHRSITIAHLANICERLGVSGLKWDPAREQVVGNDAANKMLQVDHHNGWTLG